VLIEAVLAKPGSVAVPENNVGVGSTPILSAAVLSAHVHPATSVPESDEHP